MAKGIELLKQIKGENTQQDKKQDKQKKLWGVIHGVIREIRKYNNGDAIKTFIVRNGKIIRDISHIPFNVDISLKPDESIITLRNTSIGILNNKYKSKNRSIRYTPVIEQKYKGNGIERLGYYDNTLMLNNKALSDVLDFAKEIGIINKIQKNYTTIEMILIIKQIVKYLKTTYQYNHKHDSIIYHEMVLNLLRNYPKRIITYVKRKERKNPKYLLPYKQKMKYRDIEPKFKEYPNMDNIHEYNRKTITFATFKKLLKEGKIKSYEDIKNLKIKNTTVKKELFYN